MRARALANSLFATVVAGLLTASCATQQAPVTGRDQFIIISDQQASQLGAEAFQQVQQQQNVDTSSAYAKKIQTMGNRILQANGQDSSQWKFFAVGDETPNAFALPGGYVGVHTGMADYARTDAQLAAVIGHEIAHVQAQHASERVSRDVIQNVGLQAVGAATGAATAQIASQVAQVALTLPFTRSQESEADIIGLEYMARAGYDPRAAIELWQNMEEAGGGTPEFLSTHPSGSTRIQRLNQHMDQALAIYRQQ